MASRSRYTYHVFLSFRGIDTRKAFTDHLYAALEHAEIRTFRDDDELPRGENINPELQKAIRESRISVVVISKNYASSRWCLDELVEILERKRTVGHQVLPVFYDVHPSQVGLQTGSFAEAFSDHEMQVKTKTNEEKKEWMERIERWRAALREVVDLGGKVLQDQSDGHESRFIQEIVKYIRSKLNLIVFNGARYPIRIDSRAKSINLWLENGSTNVVMGVICGMGGIGKTTIAKTVYNSHFERFEGSSFLADVRKRSEQPKGLIRLQRQLLSDILKGRKEKIYNIHEGITKIKNVLCFKRVLIVLDDVDQQEHLEVVFEMRDWFCHGSKILITTRNERLLKAHEVYKMFKIRELDDGESLKLLSLHAFGQGHPKEGYKEQSATAVQHCRGLPLALQVLGSSLFGRSVEIWKNALEKLEAIPANKIQKILEISYRSLEDEHDRNLFLHIACFFVGKKKDYAVKILDKCDFYTISGIENLMDRYLVTMDEKNKLRIHQLLQDMAREIVRQESPEPGNRSRLWHHKDTFYVLKGKTGTDKIQGLVLDMHLLKEDKSFLKKSKVNNKRILFEDSADKSLVLCEGNSSKRRRLGLDFFSWQPMATALSELYPAPTKSDLSTDSFSAMHKLRILKLNHVQLSGDYNNFPKGVRWLCWHGFSSKSMPNDFPLESLIALDLQYSSLKQAWKGTKFLRLRKILNLSHSEDLTRTPDMSGLPNLERLMLKKCVNLVRLHESIGDLERLVFLSLKGCENLSKLPRKIGQMKSLAKLILTGCSKLEYLPMDLEKSGSLLVLHANRTAINKLNHMKGKDDPLTKFIWFWASRPSKKMDFNLNSLPRTLRKLNLADCNLSDDAIPRDLTGLPLLVELDLSGNPISTLPESIGYLTMLKSLWLQKCTRLLSLPGPPLSLREFNISDCKTLKRVIILPELLKSLTIKLLDGCEELVNVDGLYRLEPLLNSDEKLLLNFGFVNLEMLANTEVEMCNVLTRTRLKGPIQGLHEFGIFNTFLPGNRVPSWFNDKNIGSSISFTVPSVLNLKIQGLNVCVVYSPSDDRGYARFHDLFIKISNKSKGLEWTYCPTCYADGDMMWLSHWRISDQMEAGDEVSVSAIVGYGLQVKECGTNLMYGPEEMGRILNSGQELTQCNMYPSNKNVFHGDISAYQKSVGAYLLSNNDSDPYLHPPEEKPPSDRWDDPDIYDPSIWCPIYDTDVDDIDSDEEEEDDDDDF